MNDLLGILRQHQVNFSCVNRVELDRQHLADVDLVVAVGGDGTVLSSAHFLDHGTIPLLGINSDPMISKDDRSVKKKSDERRLVLSMEFCHVFKMLFTNDAHVDLMAPFACALQLIWGMASLLSFTAEVFWANALASIAQ